MSTEGGAGRRSDFLSRLERTEQRQDAAAAEQEAAESARWADAELRQGADDRDALRAAIQAARLAAEELRAAAAEARQLNAEMRLGFRELLDELRRRAGHP